MKDSRVVNNNRRLHVSKTDHGIRTQVRKLIFKTIGPFWDSVVSRMKFPNKCERERERKTSSAKRKLFGQKKSLENAINKQSKRREIFRQREMFFCRIFSLKKVPSAAKANQKASLEMIEQVGTRLKKLDKFMNRF